MFDVKGNGKIKVRDVFPLIRSLGHNPIEAAVWCYLNELDLAGQLEQFIYGRPFPCDSVGMSGDRGCRWGILSSSPLDFANKKQVEEGFDIGPQIFNSPVCRSPTVLR